jgi:hypothetical protein
MKPNHRNVRKAYLVMAWLRAPDLSAHIEVRCFSQKEARAICRRNLPKAWRIMAVQFQDYKPRPNERTPEVLAFVEACRRKDFDREFAILRLSLGPKADG